MAGVESVIGGIHRDIVKERIFQFDENYTKKWLIRDLNGLTYNPTGVTRQESL